MPNTLADYDNTSEYSDEESDYSEKEDSDIETNTTGSTFSRTSFYNRNIFALFPLFNNHWLFV